MNVELIDVHLAYGSGPDVSSLALECINLKIASGECIGVSGEEGSGKTTLLNVAACLIRPTRGAVLFDGIDCWNGSVHLPLLRRKCSVAFQFPEEQFISETVREELVYARGPHTDRDDEIFTTLSIEEQLLDRSPLSLSCGEAKLVSIASALGYQCGLVLLDEPTAGLDGFGMEGLRRAIHRLRGKTTTIVVVSHDLEFLSGVADRVIVLDRGRVVGQRSPRSQSKNSG